MTRVESTWYHHAVYCYKPRNFPGHLVALWRVGEIRYDGAVFKILKGIVKLVFLGVVIVGVGFIPWKGKPLKDHGLGYAEQGWGYIQDKAYLLSRFEEKKRREILAQFQKLKKERRQTKRKISSKESITASEEKRLEELLEKHSK